MSAWSLGDEHNWKVRNSRCRRGVLAMNTSRESDEGSLIILVITLAMVLLVSSLALINISNNFLAKRELVEIGEVAISKAAHQISLSRYYSGNILMDNSAADGAQFRIPLDCDKAYATFGDEIASTKLRAQSILITNWRCVNDEVTVGLEAEIPVLLQLSFGIGSATTVVKATIAATSIIGGLRG